MEKSRTIRVLQIGPDVKVKGGVSSVERLILSDISDSVEVSHFPTTHDGNRLSKIFYGILSWIFLPFKLIRFKPDLVHIHFASRGSTWRKIPISLISKIFKKPVVLHSHGAEFRDFYLDECGALRRMLVNNFLNRSNKIIVLSKSWERFFVEDCGIRKEKIVVLSNPVDTKLLRPLDKPIFASKNLKIVTNGRLGARKGTYESINAISHIDSSIKENIQYSMTGDGDKDKFIRLISTLELGDTIKITGWVSEEELIEIRKSAHVFLLPSRNEGLPMAMIEAMALGLVPIVTPVGGIPEVVKDMENGIIVKIGDIEDISNALTKLYNDRGLLKRLSNNARKTAQLFDITNYILDLEKIYQETRAKR